jgi:hypothetical protein
LEDDEMKATRVKGASARNDADLEVEMLEATLAETSRIIAEGDRRKRGGNSGADQLRNADGSINTEAVFAKWNKKRPHGKKPEDESDDA